MCGERKKKGTINAMNGQYKRHSTINAVCVQQKGQNRAKSHVTDIKKKNVLAISRIPFKVGNSVNSATFPHSRKITGPRSPQRQFSKITLEQVFYEVTFKQK